VAIKAVSKLTEVSGDAFILQPGSAPVEGSFHRNSKTGDVDVQFGSIPDGLLVLVLGDGHDSRYPGAFASGTFQSHVFPGHGALPLPPPEERAAKKAAVEKAAKDKAAAEKKAAADAKAAADKAAADAKAAADKKAEEEKAAADKAKQPPADNKPADNES